MVATSQNALSDLPRDMSRSRTRWKELRAVGAFAVLLRQAIKLDNIALYTQQSRGNAPLLARPPQHLRGVHPPSAVNMALHSLGPSDHFPMPLAQGQWEAWYSRHIRLMCSPAFLAAGRWRGYYTHPHSWPEFAEPPMIDIQFERVAPQRADDNVVNSRRDDDALWSVRGRGRDGVGPFTLSGRVSGCEGRLDLRKEYRDMRLAWEWRCSMTPFGIFGSWGCDTGRRDWQRFGAVWIWREEWERGAGAGR